MVIRGRARRRPKRNQIILEIGDKARIVRNSFGKSPYEVSRCYLPLGDVVTISGSFGDYYLTREHGYNRIHKSNLQYLSRSSVVVFKSDNGVKLRHFQRRK